jgi:hypothetical protein
MAVISNLHHAIIDIGVNTTPRSGPSIVDPDISRNPVHPAIQSRSGLPLVARFKGAFDRGLAQIIRVSGMLGQSARKAAQSRHNRKQFLFKCHSIPSWLYG